MSKQQRIFIAGTDTAVGKTYCCVGLLRAFASQGYSTLGLKLIASGCEKNEAGALRNDDALQLIDAASEKLAYAMINPYALEEPIAPHLAAKKSNLHLSAAEMIKHSRSIFKKNIDIILLEGAGGLKVPLNDTETYADYIQQLKLPVILIVGMRLGCINHTLLTAAVMQQMGIPLLGWFANEINTDMPMFAENIDTIHQFMSAPLLGVVRAQEAIPMATLSGILFS